MSFTHGSVVFLSVRAHEVSCRVRAGEVARPAIVSGWKRRRLHPKGPRAAPGSDSVDRLGPPPPSTVFVGVPAQWMEFGAKGRGGPPLGKARLAWVTTVTCDADHVTLSGISVPAWGKP